MWMMIDEYCASLKRYADQLSMQVFDAFEIDTATTGRVQ